MRVLIVAGYFPKLATPTAGVWALEQTKALKRAGVEVVVVSPTPWVPPGLSLTNKLRRYSQVPTSDEIEGVQVYYPKCLYYPSHFARRTVFARLPYLESLPPWLGSKQVIYELNRRHQFDIVHCHHPLMEGAIGNRIKKTNGLPFAVTEHSVSDVKLAKKSRLRCRAYRKVIKNAARIITVSRRVADEMQPLLEGVSVTIVPNGVHLSKVRSVNAPRPVELRNKKVVLSVGALSERKGHDFLIEAIHRLKPTVPNIKCIIIGAGRNRDLLEDLTKKLGLIGCVEILGKRPHTEVLKYMSWCDVFALPSWDEPFATVYPEAMSLGKPIIACSGEGTDDVLKSGENGMLVEKKDIGSLASALNTLLRDLDLARTMGEKAKKLAEECLTWDANGARMIEIFEDILFSP